MYTRLSSLTYPDGTVIDYNYGTSGEWNDRVSRLSSLLDGSTHLEDYLYLGLAVVVQRSHPESGVDMTYIGAGTAGAGDQYVGLDRFGRVVDVRWKTGSADLDRFQYGYDRSANRLWRDNLVNSAYGELYTYDGLNQFASFDRGTLNSGHTVSIYFATASRFRASPASGCCGQRSMSSVNSAFASVDCPSIKSA